jgi:hypothetical protein
MGEHRKGAHKEAPATKTTPDAPEPAVEEKPAPDTIPAPADTNHQPRPRRIAPQAQES